MRDTCELMETLPLDDKSIEVIVVDNASANNEASIIEQRYPQVIVIRSQDNLGFAGGNNLGIKAAHGRYLFFINNDTLFRPQISNLRLLINRLESDKKIGAVCPKIRFSWGENLIQYAGYTPLTFITMRNRSIGFGEVDNGQYDTAHPTPYVHGAAMLVKREAIKRAGMMPECYFLYYEELDWSMMLHRAGYELWYDPSVTIYHKESQATGQNSPIKTYYLVRNRLLFVRRNVLGIEKYISYLYQIGIVSIKDVVKYLSKRRFDLAKATIKGIRAFIFNSPITT